MYVDQQREEALSWAHVRAIAGQAGVDLSIPERDHGVDGTFIPILETEDGRVPSSLVLDFQLKSSIRALPRETDVVYDLEVRAYNYLVSRGSRGTPCLLLLKVLSPDPELWIETSDDRLIMNGACYWIKLIGERSSNKKTVRIWIPRQQLLTPRVLRDLLERLYRREGL